MPKMRGSKLSLAIWLCDTEQNAIGLDPSSIRRAKALQGRFPVIARQHHLFPPNKNTVGMAICCRARQLYWSTLCLEYFPLRSHLLGFNLVEQDDIMLAQAVGSEIRLGPSRTVDL